MVCEHCEDGEGELLRRVPSNDGKYILVSHEVDLVEEPEVTEDSSNFFGTFWNGVQNQNDEDRFEDVSLHFVATTQYLFYPFADLCDGSHRIYFLGNHGTKADVFSI